MSITLHNYGTSAKPKVNAGGGAAKKKAMPDKTASWPEPPAKAQPKDRSVGVKKIKTHAMKKGL